MNQENVGIANPPVLIFLHGVSTGSVGLPETHDFGHGLDVGKIGIFVPERKPQQCWKQQLLVRCNGKTKYHQNKNLKLN
jgi:hypothetical protein